MDATIEVAESKSEMMREGMVYYFSTSCAVVEGRRSGSLGGLFPEESGERPLLFCLIPPESFNLIAHYNKHVSTDSKLLKSSGMKKLTAADGLGDPRT